MPADITLVKGARDAAPKFSGIELFSEEQLRTMQQATMARKALKATRDAAISALVSDITVNESLTPPQQIDAQYAAAGNIRNQVAALAAQRAKLPVNSPEAFALDQQISTLKQSFNNISGNAKDFQELQQEYIDGSWNMSGGVKEEDRNKLDAIFAKNEYTIEFDERGNATYITEFGNMSQKDLSNYYLKDDEMALQIVDYSDEALSLGSQGTLIKKDDSRYNMLKTKIRNDIRKGGEARMNSLIYDPLVDGFDLQLTDLGDRQLNENQAVEAIMENLMRVNEQGHGEYKSKPTNSPGGNQEEENLTPSEKTRREKAKLNIESTRKALNNKPAPNFTYNKKEADKLGLKAKEYNYYKIRQYLGKEITNIVNSDGGQVIEKDGRFFLIKQNNQGTVIKRMDITDLMNGYMEGDKEPLFKKIEDGIYDTEEVDYQTNSSDNIL